MSLSEDQKQQIKEEEQKKLEEEKFRDDIRKNLNKTPWWKPKGKAAKIGLIVVGIWIVGAIFQGTISPSSNSSGVNSKPNVITEEYKENLAKMFCDNRSDGKPYYDLQWIADSINQKNIGEHPNYITKKPLPENCKIVADFSLRAWGKEDAENIANKKIWIGMTNLQLIYSWGMPKNINDTTTVFGIRSQWVYGTFKPYVYLEGKSKDDLKVTSWQD